MQKLPLFRAIEVLAGLSVLLFIIGNFTFIAGDRREAKRDEKVVLGEETEEVADVPTVTPEIEEEKVEVKIENKTLEESSPTPTAPAGNNSISSDFVYPGATNTGGSTYESSDSPDAITEWYKNEITSRNMNVKTFVTTKTNGNVLNKLAGADGDVNIEIEIEKKEGDSSTKITIKR